MKFRAFFIAVTAAFLFSACGAMNTGALSGAKSDPGSASVYQEKDTLGDSTNTNVADPSAGPDGTSTSPTPKSGSPFAPAPGDSSAGDSAAYAPSPTGSPTGGDSSPSAYKKKAGSGWASAGDAKSAKADPVSACMHLSPVAYAEEFKTKFADGDHEVLSQDGGDPTSFELFPGDDVNAMLLIQAKIHSDKKEKECEADDWKTDDCWIWTSDMPGYIRIIETTAAGDSNFIDIPVDLQTWFAPSVPKFSAKSSGKAAVSSSISFLRYNVDIEKLHTRFGSTLELRYFMLPCIAPGEERVIISETLQPYTPVIQKNFTSVKSHTAGYLHIDLPDSFTKKAPSTLPGTLKDADKAETKKSP